MYIIINVLKYGCKSCNSYQNKLCFMLMRSSGKFLKWHLSTLFRNSSVTKTSNKTVTRQIGIWNLQSPQSSKLKCLVLRHKIAEATWRFCNLHRQFLARYFCRGLHWNPYNYFGIYLNILMMINYCTDKNRIHFWQLYWFITDDYSRTEEFILVECVSSSIEYIVI